MKGKAFILSLGLRTALTVLVLLCEGARGQKIEAVSAAMADVGNKMAKLQKLMMGEIKKMEQPSSRCNIYTQINDVSRKIYHIHSPSYCTILSVARQLCEGEHRM